MRLEAYTPPIGFMARIADAEKALFRRAQYKALDSEGDKIKNAGRNAVRGAKIRGASRLATAIRGDIFPRGKNIYPKSPAYVIGTNAEIPLDNLETGAVITARGRGLMVPIGEAARFKQPNFATRAGRLSRTIAAMEAKYGKLSWHKLRDGTLALGAWAKTRSGGQLRFKALFIVRKSVTILKKHDASAQMRRAAQGWEPRVADETMRIFAAEHDQVVGRITGNWTPTR